MARWTWQRIQRMGKFCEVSFRVCPMCAGRVRSATRADVKRLRVGRYFRNGDIPAIDKVCDNCGVDFNVKSYNPASPNSFIAKAMSARPWRVISHKTTAFVWIHPKTGAVMHWDFACNAAHKRLYVGTGARATTPQIFFRFAVA